MDCRRRVRLGPPTAREHQLQTQVDQRNPKNHTNHAHAYSQRADHQPKFTICRPDEDECQRGSQDLRTIRPWYAGATREVARRGPHCLLWSGLSQEAATSCVRQSDRIMAGDVSWGTQIAVVPDENAPNSLSLDYLGGWPCRRTISREKTLRLSCPKHRAN